MGPLFVLSQPVVHVLSVFDLSTSVNGLALEAVTGPVAAGRPAREVILGVELVLSELHAVNNAPAAETTAKAIIE